MPIRTFHGKTAVVTGGGSGIGLAVATALARERCSLALLDTRGDRIEDARRSLEYFGAKLSTHVCDVADLDSVRAAREAILAEHSVVHILINSAGVSLAGPFAEQTPDDIDWIMRINFMGTVNCCHAFLPDLVAPGEGHIVNVSSSFGLMGMRHKAGYSASKFAVRGFSEALRMELADRGVGVTVLYPGPVSTNIVLDGRAPSPEQQHAEFAFLSKRAVSPDLVAQRTLAGIRRNHTRIIISTDYRAIDLATRLFPTWSQRLAKSATKRLPF